MGVKKSDGFRAAIVTVLVSLLAIAGQRYLMPFLPDTVTNTVWAWVIIVTMALAVSLYWEKANVVCTLIGTAVLSALAVSIPASRNWVAGATILIFLVWLALPRIATWTAPWQIKEETYDTWIDKGSLVEKIRELLLNNNRDFETNEEILKRIADAIRRKVLKGYYSRDYSEDIRITPENVDEALQVDRGYPKFWSRGVDELMRQIGKEK